jgi:hypothetical protein
MPLKAVVWCAVAMAAFHHHLMLHCNAVQARDNDLAMAMAMAMAMVMAMRTTKHQLLSTNQASGLTMCSP